MTTRRATGAFMAILAAFIFSVFGFLGTCSINNGLVPNTERPMN